MTTIETERLLLRRWEFDDLQALHDLTASERMQAHLGGAPPSMEDSFNRMMRNGGCWHFFGWGPFKAIERTSGELVGNVGLFRGIRGLGEDFDPFPEAGWVIREASWGLGYATEGMRAALDLFDRQHGGGRTVCMISLGNSASDKVAGKLGYRPIGIAPYKGEEVMRYARDPA